MKNLTLHRYLSIACALIFFVVSPLLHAQYTQLHNFDWHKEGANPAGPALLRRDWTAASMDARYAALASWNRLQLPTDGNSGRSLRLSRQTGREYAAIGAEFRMGR